MAPNHQAPSTKRQTLFLSALIVMTISQVFGQNLYMPRNIIQAFKKGTRAMDGRPGKNYWQNYARYAINVTVNPPNRAISGTEDITYVNNSPDTLVSLTFKLILNTHTPGAVRQVPASNDYLTSGIHIDKYTENKVVKKWEDVGTATWQRVPLTKALAPHDSVQLSIAWHFDISIESGREGALDSTTFFLAYFYPRVSVYDDYYGWDRINFTEAQEFYNDFNDYAFSVTVPSNYLVWATGDLQNAGEVLQPEYVRRLNKSFSTDSIIHVVTAKDLTSKNVTAQQPTTTWRWKASTVSDIAIAVSDHYNWDASSVVVDNTSHRRAGVQAAYHDATTDFHKMVEYGRHSLDWFSRQWPGVPYPYSKTTVVQGFADMEYPMMVNDSHQDNPVFTRFIAEHEIAHTWFPFYMGVNETRYGFMDEGWATALEYLIGIDDLGKETADGYFKQFRVSRWIRDPSADEDLPIITPTSVLSGVAMGNNEYGKAALGYLAVKELLGDALFRKCLHEFMSRWNGKHPLPWDMFATFNNVSGKDLNWFWHNWFFTNHYIDLAVAKVDLTSKGATITIDNVGGYPAPVNVVIRYTDGTKETLHQTPEIWTKDQKQTVINVATKKKIQAVALEGGIFMDADESNNSWTGSVSGK